MSDASQSTQNVLQKTINAQEERILVVERTQLFEGDIVPSGMLRTSMEVYEQCVWKHKQFLPRSHAEHDPRYKQIIPYFIFAHGDKYFLMRRGGSSSENRLHHRYTFGIGGHIRESDMQNVQSIAQFGMREFHEEVIYTDAFSMKPLGIINDERDSVGQVHTGFVYLVEGSTADIAIRSELVWGNLLSLSDCAPYYELLESWSRMVYDQLCMMVKQNH